MLFLRKLKSFNKSRYSRNRQTTRVMYYFAVYINLLILFAIFSVIYGMVFKFSILWWAYFGLLSSLIYGAFTRAK